MRRGHPSAAAAALVVAVACGHSGGGPEATSTTAPVFDTREAESRLLATQRRATPDLDVRDASCPARVVLSEGAKFQCTVVVDGVVVPYQITVTNIASDRFGYDIRPAKAILLIPKLVDALQRNSPGSRIDCGPDRIRVLDVGATFDCRLTDAQGLHTVTLHVDDELGNVSQVPTG